MNRKSRKSIVCFDLDGTITAEEVLPRLSRELGLYNEIAALTSATISGVIPFKESFLLRCRLLKDIKIKRVHEIMETIELNLGVVDFINNHKDECLVVTGNLDLWIEPFKKKILCPFVTSLATESPDGNLGEVVSVLDKASFIKDLRSKKRYEKIVSVGDGMGDVGMFEFSDVKIAFGKVHSPVSSLISVSDYICFSETTLCNILSTQL